MASLPFAGTPRTSVGFSTWDGHSVLRQLLEGCITNKHACTESSQSAEGTTESIYFWTAAIASFSINSSVEVIVRVSGDHYRWVDFPQPNGLNFK